MDLDKFRVDSPDMYHDVPLSCVACDNVIASGEFSIRELIEFAEAHEPVCDPKIWVCETRDRVYEDYPETWSTYRDFLTDSAKQKFEADLANGYWASYTFRFVKREF